MEVEYWRRFFDRHLNGNSILWVKIFSWSFYISQDTVDTDNDPKKQASSAILALQTNYCLSFCLKSDIPSYCPHSNMKWNYKAMQYFCALELISRWSRKLTIGAKATQFYCICASSICLDENYHFKWYSDLVKMCNLRKSIESIFGSTDLINVVYKLQYNTKYIIKLSLILSALRSRHDRDFF